MSELKLLNPDFETHVQSIAENRALRFPLTHHQQLYLDKLRLELKALHKNLHDLIRDDPTRIQ